MQTPGRVRNDHRADSENRGDPNRCHYDVGRMTLVGMEAPDLYQRVLPTEPPEHVPARVSCNRRLRVAQDIPEVHDGGILDRIDEVRESRAQDDQCVGVGTKLGT